MRNILEIEGECENPKMIVIPSATYMNSFEKRVLKNLGKYGIDPSHDVKYHVIDAELDTWALNQRNILLKVGKQRIDPSFLTEGYIQKMMEEAEADKFKDQEIEEMGFFVGKKVSSLLSREKKTDVFMTRDKQAALLRELDKYEASDIHGDYDFNKEHFKCPDGRYHWQVLADNEYEEFVEEYGHLPLDVQLVMREKKSTYKVVKPTDKEKWKEGEFELETIQVDHNNMLNYKLNCYHPRNVDSLDNIRSDDGKKKKNRFYPDEMLKDEENLSRQCRWKKGSDVPYDPKAIAAELSKDRPTVSFCAHRLSGPKKKASLMPTGRYVSVGNSMKGQIKRDKEEIIMRNKKKRESLETNLNKNSNIYSDFDDSAEEPLTKKTRFDIFGN